MCKSLVKKETESPFYRKSHTTCINMRGKASRMRELSNWLSLEESGLPGGGEKGCEKKSFAGQGIVLS